MNGGNREIAFETVVISSEHLDRLLVGEVKLHCRHCHVVTWHTRVCGKPPHRSVKATYIARARTKTFRCQECGAVSKLKQA